MSTEEPTPIEIGDNYKLFAIDEKCSKWLGFPDPRYSWDGNRLRKDTPFIDEDGKPQVGASYKDPIEIVADFKPGVEVSLASPEIKRAVTQKFRGALKGFVWLDNISGGGTVVLPRTGNHVFLVRDKLNPVLEEISTSGDDYYEVIDGKTYIHAKSFSGVGMAAGAPPTLIAHYKMNENTASDGDELVTNGTFAAWTSDDPDGWTISGESGNDPEISEAATGEAHADTPTAGGGMCNLYTSDGTSIQIYEELTLVIGRKYRFSITIDTVTAGKLRITETRHTMWTNAIYESGDEGIRTFTFVATHTDPRLQIIRNAVEATDITFDDVSVKLCAAEDSSGNDHDGLLQEDTSAAHVTGKINGAFDFDGSADYIEIADHADFTPALTPFSISAWVYMHDATNFMIANKGIYNTDGEWRLFTLGNDKIRFRCMDESVDNCYIGRRYDTGITAYQNQWIHLVGTYDGGTSSSGIRIYLNGTYIDDSNEESSASSFVAVENLAAPVYIGRYDTTYADGLIDNVMIFSKELTQNDVNILYNAGSGTEIPAELDQQSISRRGNLSPTPLRRRYEV